MKKNTKKRRTIRRLLIATAFALLMIPASVSADVVGKKLRNLTNRRNKMRCQKSNTPIEAMENSIWLSPSILQRATL